MTVPQTALAAGVTISALVLFILAAETAWRVMGP